MNYLDLVFQDPTGSSALGLAERGIYLSTDDKGRTVSFHLAEDIGSPADFTEFLEVTRCLSPEDFLEVVISGSPGGQLYGAQVMTTAMDTCPASIDVVVIGNIASAATMVAMAGDNLIMTQGSSMMVHNASYGIGGKASDIAASVKFSTKDIADTMKHYYRPFLSKKELKQVLNGEEKYYDARDCMERFAKVKAKRAEDSAKAQKEYWKAQREVLAAQLVEMDEALGMS